MSDAARWHELQTATFSNEAEVETRLVHPLLRLLGFDESDIASKKPVEFRFGRKGPGRKPEADIVVYGAAPHTRSTSLITVEAKHPNQSLVEAREQGESYAYELRTPILLLTNGIDLEVWQINVAADLEYLFSAKISKICASRGEIESVLRKPAILEHAKKLKHKNFLVEARDLFAYEKSVFDSAVNSGNYIHRTLSFSGNQREPFKSSEFFKVLPRGAVIQADSGLGKTTLINILSRIMIEDKWSNNSSAKIPIIISLQDFVFSGKNLIEFAYDRLEAHCPEVSFSQFRDFLRKGAAFFIDAFDRIGSNQYQVLEAELRTIIRDYPNCVFCLFTRPGHGLMSASLPKIILEPLTDEELIELLDLRSPAENSGRWLFRISEVPSGIKDLTRIPLIIDLLINHYIKQGTIAVDISEIYAHWLSQIIDQVHPITERIQHETALSHVALHTKTQAISVKKAIDIIVQERLDPKILDTLVRIGALVVRGKSIEICHESLGDFFRARHIAENSADDIEDYLEFDSSTLGSQLPIILFSMVESEVIRSKIWDALVRGGIDLACTSLVFSCIKPKKSADTKDANLEFLQGVLEGVEAPIRWHFRTLRSKIYAELSGSAGKNLQLFGGLRDQGSWADLAFYTTDDDAAPSILTKRAARPSRIIGGSTTQFRKLADEGRLHGMSEIQNAIQVFLRKRELDGGPVTREEHCVSRIRHLSREYNFPFSTTSQLPHIISVLKNFSNEFVSSTDNDAWQRFEISDLISDLTLILEQGRQSIHNYWRHDDYDKDISKNSQRILSIILNIFYRRVQKCYTEVVEKNFPTLANKFPYYQILPLKYKIHITPSRMASRNLYLSWKYVPVQTWREAGADVAFCDADDDFYSRSKFQSYIALIDSTLAKLGRNAPDCRYSSGQCSLPDFYGEEVLQYDLHHESAVARSAFKKIADDLGFVFRHLPSSHRPRFR